MNIQIGFLPILALLFIGLKLTSYITWSWWWVLSPLWVPVAILIAVGLIMFITTVVLHLIRNGL
jgi:hypothetical protein